MEMHYFTEPLKPTPTHLASSGRLLSLREAVVLAGVPDEEKAVRNDITHGILSGAHIVRIEDMRLAFNWPFVISFAAAYGNEMFRAPDVRGRVFEKVLRAASGPFLVDEVWSTATVRDWSEVVGRLAYNGRLAVDRYVTVELSDVCKDVRPRINLYAEGLARVEERSSILGGNAVFKESRLSVLHVGKMADAGVPSTEIIEDYPYLTEGDVMFAKLYFNARPPLGRPPGNKKIGGNADRDP